MVDLTKLWKMRDILPVIVVDNMSGKVIKHGYMNKDAFAKCKKGAFFVNTARGGLVDEPALKQAVESGHLSGAGLDAITVEPMRNCILQGVENIVITPHAAWAPMSTRIKLLNITVDCIKGWINGNPINVVSKL